MTLLLDSHVLIAIMRGDTASLPAIARLLRAPSNRIFVSAASLWEIAIKVRLGKLVLTLPLDQIPAYFLALGYVLLAIDHRHAIEDLVDPPSTRDPFDRLLLAQCQVEGSQLVTLDRALVAHPLAWRAP